MSESAENTRPRETEATACDPVEAPRAAVDVDALFEAHVDWAVGLARGFVRSRRIPLFLADDLENAARFAVWSAARRFDGMDSGNRFRPYAYPGVHGALRDELARATSDGATLRNVELDMGKYEARVDVCDAVEAYESSELVEATLTACGLRARRICEALISGQRFRTVAKSEKMGPKRMQLLIDQVGARLKAELN